MSAWIDQIFNATIVSRKGVTRRKISTIEKYASKDELEREAKRRGYHIVQHGDQWLIFCDPDVKFI